MNEGLLRLVATGKIDEVRGILKDAPTHVNEVAPHPFWGGQLQPLHIALKQDSGKCSICYSRPERM